MTRPIRATPRLRTHAPSGDSAAAKYVRAGFVLVPIPRGSKGPTGKGWNLRENCISAEADAAKLGGNIGIAHAYSHTAALDVDDYKLAAPWLKARGVDLAALLLRDDAVQITSGRENRVKLLYRLPAHATPLPTRQEPRIGLEFRCATANGLTVQDVLPPSIHPNTGRPYGWRGNWRALPELPAELLTLWQAPATTQAPADATALRRHRDDWILLTLRKIGLYKRDLHDGRHEITCPWVDEHTGNIDAGTVYFEPGARGRDYDGFKCQHTHCAAQSIKDLRHYLRRIACAVPLSDMGNAARFADQHAANIRFVSALDGKQTSGWFIFNGQHWQQDTQGRIVELVKRSALAFRASIEENPNPAQQEQMIKWVRRTESSEGLTAAVALAQSDPRVVAEPADFNRDPLLFGVANGVIDLGTGALREVRRGDFITRQAPVAFDAAAQCPRWMRFLDEIFAGDAAMVSFMQRLFGYAITGFATEEKAFFLFGCGANGKSTVISTLEKLAGDWFKEIAPTSLLKRLNPGEIRNDIALLHDRRIAYANETEEGAELDMSLIKLVTTPHGNISARFLYGEPFTFAPRFKLFYTSNHKPRIRGTDHGTWRRLCLVPFNVVIPEARKDAQLPAKLWNAEAPGILNWTIAGCLEWQRNGLRIPDAVRAATEDYRRESDDFGRYLEEHIAHASGAFLAHKALYEDFRFYAEERGIRFVPTSDTIAKRMRERGYKSVRQGKERTRGYADIELIGAPGL